MILPPVARGNINASIQINSIRRLLYKYFFILICGASFWVLNFNHLKCTQFHANAKLNNDSNIYSLMSTHNEMGKLFVIQFKLNH